MGRSSTPAYRVEYTTDSNAHLAPAAWRISSKKNGAGKVILQGLGRPSEETIKEHVKVLNQSFCVGGVNHFAGDRVIKIVSARAVRQSDGHVVAEWVDLNHASKLLCEARAAAVKAGAL